MNDKPDPLEEIRRLRVEQLRVCALQQAADINRLHRAAQAAAQLSAAQLSVAQSSVAQSSVVMPSMSGACGESDAAK